MKVYLDTSVYGGYHQEEFPDSITLFEWINDNDVLVIVSKVVYQELSKPDDPLKSKLLGTFNLIYNLQFMDYTQEMETLAQQYLSVGILPANSIEDARHIAFATIHEVRDVISWNMKHMVNCSSGYNSINLQNGKQQVNIYTPKYFLKKVPQ